MDTNPTSTDPARVSAGPARAAADGWRRPGSLDELRAELDAYPHLDAVERARRAPGLIEATKTVLADERGRAMAEATAGGLGPTALARELGITRAKVYESIARATAAGLGSGDRA